MESTDKLLTEDNESTIQPSQSLNNHIPNKKNSTNNNNNNNNNNSHKKSNKKSKLLNGLNNNTTTNQTNDLSNEINKSTSSLEKLINSGTYIDHRKYDDLAHLHSSPARSRRRSNGNIFKKSNSINNYQTTNTDSQNYNQHPNIQHVSTSPTLPLTNRNLQSLLRNSSTSSDKDFNYPNNINNNNNNNDTNGNISPNAIAVDMDQFTKEQRQFARSQSWQNPFENDDGEIRHVYSDNFEQNGRNNPDDQDSYSVNSLEFGESNPSSDHSSDSTSLDDVCYYDYQRDDEKRNEWPNLEVLEEFIKEEYEEIEKEQHQKALEHKHTVNFGKDVVHDSHSNKYAPTTRPTTTTTKSAASSPPLTTSTTKITKKDSYEVEDENDDDKAESDENTPLIDNFKVNELDSLDSLHDSFRIRPTPTQPWEKSKDQIPTILNRGPSFNNPQNSNSKEGELCRFTYFREDLAKTIHSPTLGGLINNEESNLTIYERLVELFRPNIKVSGAPSTSSHSHNNNNNNNNNNNHKKQESLSSSNLQALKVPRIGNETPLPLSVGDLTISDPFWLDVLDPTEEEMKVISRTFGIHPLTTEDIFLGEAREKVELFKSYYFICFTSFDVIYERRKQRAKEQEKKFNKLQEMYDNLSDTTSLYGHNGNSLKVKVHRFFSNIFRRNKRKFTNSVNEIPLSTTVKSKTKKIREGELSPLNMYIIVFKNAVITFHFSPTPHPINVRRRARMLKDYLTVSSDWICYALIDDITDSFAPMIESIEVEVNSIEDAILRMHSGEHDDSDDSDSEDENESQHYNSSHYRRQQQKHQHQQFQQQGIRHRKNQQDPHENVFIWRKRSKSTVDHNNNGLFKMNKKTKSKSSTTSTSTSDTGSSKILGWKRKGDMLRRIGECRKRVMSVLRLLSSKADVIKGFSKRFNDLDSNNLNTNYHQHQSEIAMYLGDIQDHIVTMSQALNHYEKLLARFHSNYLAQINIDMTKVNNDTNDVLGKITILGTIVLPINVVTGLWGMNCLVPGQDYDGLAWFWCIVGAMALFSLVAYNYARKVTGL
ncbi:MNR2 [Candida jiufengensis]|uniref:MNR2 n=1 Tax=Candida jiufengensis TaxID=497108 RepID=UPI002224FFBA|nr:MNR2 [Candida jiufengensis]KAI5955366.1 MNR2 [Candida jiufengensis]